MDVSDLCISVWRWSIFNPIYYFCGVDRIYGVIGEMSFGRGTRSGPIDAFGTACERHGKEKSEKHLV